MNSGLKAIITGSTGMVGEGVLHVCLKNPAIEKVLVINRKSIEKSHPKLQEIIHSNFFDLSSIEDSLKGYDSCFFCLGVSSVGMKEEDYNRLTYSLTMHVAETLSKLNTNMIFGYISGAGTDSTEKGRTMWARVKGKTENDLQKLPFKKSYGIRPGFIKPIPGLNNTHSFYKYISWLFPLGRLLFPKGFCTLTELSNCMIYLALNCPDKDIIDGKDIIQFAKLQL
ncbi:NAD-dependent epimerase/dehydratase family protein [Sunxiuqinia sp. A32]|uniref:NAD-dependent epimerase/dehydratase family protein n=1 Tax=Sunxiuqinia sp. A32 TaxID=3461496 RepID=UPI0040462AD7